MKLQIIIGSTRPGRVSARVAKWVATEAQDSFDEVEMIDLQEYKLPFFDELISPQYNPSRELNAEAKRWLDKVGEADAYIIVTPEYNRSTSAVLKNAIDHLDFQFSKKPVGLVAHGVTGGAQAVSTLRATIPATLAITVPTVVYLMDASNTMSEDGVLNDEVLANPYGPQADLKKVVAEVKWYAEALTAARK